MEEFVRTVAPNLWTYRDKFLKSFSATFEMFWKAGLIAFVVGLFFGVLLVVTKIIPYIQKADMFRIH